MAPVYSPRDYNIFIGIDVDKKRFSITVKDEHLKNVSKTMPANPEVLYNYIHNQYIDQKVICAYEAGPTGFDLYDYFTQRQQLCLVTSALSIPKARNRKVKNNRIDSQTLAHYLRSGELSAVRVPEGAYRELRHLIRSREQYAEDRKKAKQRIKGLLLYTSLYKVIKEPDQTWSGRYIQELKQLKCSEAVRHRLDMLLDDLDYAKRKTCLVLKRLRSFCKEQAEIHQYLGFLQSIQGIGFITASTVLANIGDPKNLKNVRELAGFLGLVPREHSTGDHVYRGSITHLGNRVMRTLLIEAAWIAIRHDQQLEQFYNRIRARHHHQFGASKAIVAVARKLTQIIYCVLKEQRNYVKH
jgi:transposase